MPLSAAAWSSVRVAAGMISEYTVKKTTALPIATRDLNQRLLKIRCAWMDPAFFLVFLLN